MSDIGNCYMDDKFIVIFRVFVWFGIDCVVVVFSIGWIDGDQWDLVLVFVFVQFINWLCLFCLIFYCFGEYMWNIVGQECDFGNGFF